MAAGRAVASRSNFVIFFDLDLVVLVISCAPSWGWWWGESWPPLCMEVWGGARFKKKKKKTHTPR